MGAVLTHGKELRKQEAVGSTGAYSELIPLDGDYAFPAYSAVRQMVAYGEKKGIDPSVWPLYYGVSPGEIPIEDVYRRCSILKEKLTSLCPEELEKDPWLKKVAAWLERGEVFCITE